jgi:hypothetical protein
VGGFGVGFGVVFVPVGFAVVFVPVGFAVLFVPVGFGVVFVPVGFVVGALGLSVGFSPGVACDPEPEPAFVGVLPTTTTCTPFRFGFGELFGRVPGLPPRALGGWSGAARTRSGFESDGADWGDAPSLLIESGVDGIESAATSATTSAAPTTTAAMSVGFGFTAARPRGRAPTTPRGEMTGLAQRVECLVSARSRLSFPVQRAAGVPARGLAEP